jgi:calcium-dependent protein kinase
MEQIISAVAYCHAKGICHRDLKPQNILFCDETPNSLLKIVDFGISKIYDPSLASLKGDNVKNKKMTTHVGTKYFLSPEVIKGNYTEKCDIWSLGIILYYLLSGYLPFIGENDNQVIQNILACKFTFPNSEWKNISESAKSLISSMLCPEKKRISAKEAYNSKWLKIKLKKKEGNTITFNFDKLNEYKHFNMFKKCILLFLASRVNVKEYGEIAEIFRKINSCKSGMITFEDFKNFIINNQDEEIMGGEDDDEIREKFFRIDVDLNDKIDFTEFLAANLDKSIYTDQNKLRNAFDSFDIDKNGIITKEDIINILKIEKLFDAKKLALDIIEPNDINKDGKIDFDEFCKLMKN